MAGERAEVLDLGELERPLFRGGKYGAGQGMFAAALQAGGQAQQFPFGPSGLGLKGGQARLALGKRSGFVDDQRIHLGEEIARRTAQQLVVYYRRPGGQSQFSALLDLDRAEGRFGPVLAWARERLGERLPVERLADRAAMSPRHFARRFTAETGTTPAKAVERLRLESARERVETGGEPIDRIAAATGFGDPERMRRAFVRAFGQPPQALRRTARAQPRLC